MLRTVKLLSLEKNSFSLLETILSVVVLGVLLVNFNSFFSKNNSLNQLSYDLNLIENRFDKEDYSSFSKSSKNIEIKIDNSSTQNLLVNNYTHKTQNIEIEKYD